jgi:hypothetical protein
MAIGSRIRDPKPTTPASHPWPDQRSGSYALKGYRYAQSEPSNRESTAESPSTHVSRPGGAIDTVAANAGEPPTHALAS